MEKKKTQSFHENADGSKYLVLFFFQPLFLATTLSSFVNIAFS